MRESPKHAHCWSRKQLCGYCSAPNIKNLWKIPYNRTTKMKLSKLISPLLILIAVLAMAVWGAWGQNVLSARNPLDLESGPNWGQTGKLTEQNKTTQSKESATQEPRPSNENGVTPEVTLKKTRRTIRLVKKQKRKTNAPESCFRSQSYFCETGVCARPFGNEGCFLEPS